MKKIFAILLLTLVPFAAGAQDARQRTAATIVADGLNQLPAQNPKAFDAVMQELAATGAEGIRMMAGMLVPAAEGKNAAVEYAINGVVSYATAAGREELAREVAQDSSRPWKPVQTSPIRHSCSRNCNSARRPPKPPYS